MRQIKAVGAVEGRAVAYFGHRRLFPGDIVEIADDAKLPSWAVEVGKKERVAPEQVKRLGTPRRFDAPNQKKRTVGFDGMMAAANGEAVSVAETANLERPAHEPSKAEQVALAGHDRQQQARAVRASDQDVLANG